MMAIPGFKREMIPDSRMICLSLIDPAYSGEINVVARCNTDQPFESAVWLVCWEHFTLDERSCWALAPQLSTVQDNSSVCIVWLKLHWHVLFYFLCRDPYPQRQGQCRGNCSRLWWAGWLWTGELHSSRLGYAVWNPGPGSWGKETTHL